MVEGEEVVQEYVRFTGTGLNLEGMLHLPEGHPPFPAVAVCHPHPLHGGDMDNNVVFSICEELAKVSVVALRFNFRGVGRSEGDYAEGIGEQNDVLAAMAFLSFSTAVDPKRIGLAGYSFGARVALPVALQKEEVKAVALVSPFLTEADWERAKGSLIPKLFLCGSDDRHISSREVQRLASGLAGPSRCEIIAGADHFWRSYEGQVARAVAAFFKTVLHVP